MDNEDYQVKAGELINLSYNELHENEVIICVALVDFNIKEIADKENMPTGMHYVDFLINKGYVEEKLINKFFLGDDDECEVSI